MTRTLGRLADPVSDSGIVSTGANQTSVTLTVCISYAGGAGNWFGIDDLSFVEAVSNCIDGSAEGEGEGEGGCSQSSSSSSVLMLGMLGVVAVRRRWSRR